MNQYKSCRLCPRECGIDRSAGEVGYCKMSDKIIAAKAMLHFYEEPIISGACGSGAIFFSGCSLSCVYCQNEKISRGSVGKEISVNRLSEIMLELQSAGAHNINLVTPTHFSPSIKTAVSLARADGLNIPVVYNTSSFDSVSALQDLEGYIDIYLADYKYSRSETALEYSNAAAYPEKALLAIDEMLRQAPDFSIKDGIMQKGVVIRLLLLPSHIAEAKLSLSMLYKRYGDKVWFSLMNQYTPNSVAPYPINRAVTQAEYRDFIRYAEKIGVKNAFVQESGTATDAYTPIFNNEGV